MRRQKPSTEHGSRAVSLIWSLAATLCLVAGIAVAQQPPPPQPRQPNPADVILTAQPNIDTTTPVSATAVFDPPVIRPGGAATYRVMFNALLDSVQWPEDVIAPAQLEMRSSARGQIIVPGIQGMTPYAAINYRVHATNTGAFTVPRYMVYVYGKPVTVTAATLVVVANPATPLASPRQLLLDPETTKPFVGQSVGMRVVLPGTDTTMKIFTSVKLEGEGIMTDTSMAQQRVDIFPEYGTNYPSRVYETAVVPLQPGKVEVVAQGFTGGLIGLQTGIPIQIRGSVILPGGQQPPEFFDSDPLVLQVRPLPREGQLPGFTGAIGQFKLEPPILETNALRVGDPVTFTVYVRGEGNLGRFAPPPPPSAEGWRVFAGQPDPASSQGIRSRGFIIFSYTLMPVSEELHATPVIPFSYFDPDRGKYVDLSLPSVAVSVKPGQVPVDPMATAGLDDAGAKGEPAPKLGELTTSPGRTMTGLVPFQRRGWFALAQLAPALFFGGLWWWDRRRRFYEAHPEILLRRRARRALHREWAAVRKAASLGDTSRFAACAVNAMRVACAPHYPAEPRALVSSDVMPLLDAAAGANGINATQVVSRIFAAANADRFNTQPADARDLLNLRAELDGVLAQLEDKLR
jgi:hypothetical protein